MSKDNNYSEENDIFIETERYRTEKSFKIYTIFIIIFYLLIFQDYLTSIFHVFTYLDDALGLVYFPVLMIFIANNREYKISRDNIIMTLMMLIIIVLGFWGNWKSSSQTIPYILQDVIAVNRFIFVYALSRIIFNCLNMEYYKKKISKHCSIVIALMFLLAMLEWFGITNKEISNSREILGFTIKSLTLWFSQPVGVGTFTIALLAIHVYTSQKRNYIAIAGGSILAIGSMRFKSIAMIFVFIVMYRQIILKGKYVSKRMWIVILGISAILGWGQLKYYYLDNEDAARAAMTIASVEIAKDNFPHGTGFGTFGSYVSGINYSDIYYQYDLYNVHGLSEEISTFVSDTFWPTVIAQFGFVGTIAYLVIFYLLFRKCNEMYYSKKAYFSSLVIFLFIMINTTSGSAIYHPYFTLFAVLLAMFTTETKEKNEEIVCEI